MLLCLRPGREASVAGAGAGLTVVGMRPEQAAGGLVGTVALTSRRSHCVVSCRRAPRCFIYSAEAPLQLLCGERPGGGVSVEAGGTGGPASPGEAMGLTLGVALKVGRRGCMWSSF